MNLPAIPTTTTLTFDDIMRQADVLAQSRIIPAAYRNRPPDIVAAGLAGIAFGWDVMTSLRNYHVIEGTASLRPEAMLALVRRAGHSVTLELGDHETPNGTVQAALAHGTRADNGDTHTAIFSTADAKAAGLLGKKNWEQYRDAMLTWRAVSKLCRILFPDVVLGAGYTPDEIGGPMVEVPDDTDPLASPLIPSAVAKTELIEACDGDKTLARTIWGDRGNTPISTEELQRLIDQALTESVPIAEIVEPATEPTPEPSSPSDGNTGINDDITDELVARFQARLVDITETTA